MRGRFGLVLLVALVAIFFGTNILAQTFNQLTGEKIPGAFQMNNNKISYGVAFFGHSLNVEKKEISNLWTEIKTRVPVEKEQIKQMGQDIILTGEDLLNRTADWFKQMTGQGISKDGEGLKENADLI